jgi:hypothetical protein
MMATEATMATTTLTLITLTESDMRAAAGLLEDAALTALDHEQFEKADRCQHLAMQLRLEADAQADDLVARDAWATEQEARDEDMEARADYAAQQLAFNAQGGF